MVQRFRSFWLEVGICTMPTTNHSICTFKFFLIYTCLFVVHMWNSFLVNGYWPWWWQPRSNPSVQLYFKTRLLRSNDQHEPFLAWASKYYKDLYKNLKFAEHGWHMWDVSNMTASWKANDSKATFMWDQYHYDLRSNNALNRNMLKTLFGVDVR